jgi:thiosulfate/3-mercaptopyruvate sulfurtransferase
MSYTTLISPEELLPQIHNPDWAIVDCRYWLQDSEKGRRDYLRSHIPRAVYAHMDEDLSGAVIPGQTGRHPLPDPADLAAKLSAWGIDDNVQVVACDDRGGAMAARLWFLLRWLGHNSVAVLDGGWPHWVQAGFPTREGAERRNARPFIPRVRPELVISTVQVVESVTMGSTPRLTLVDSRTPERYRGEQEPIDPVAGHIPTAISLPYPENLDEQEHFLPPDALRARFQSALGSTPPELTVFYCGSGVTATHNLLAYTHAGLGEARLYAGSWSEWITDPGRPIATGSKA